MTAQRRISAGTPLRECPEGKLGLAVPLPLSDRLDALVAIAETDGDRTNRKEVVASLIYGAKPESADLLAILRNYRQATAGDARLDGRANDSTVPLPTRRPGPRPRKRG
jgi:hypothetical protein